MSGGCAIAPPSMTFVVVVIVTAAPPDSVSTVVKNQVFATPAHSGAVAGVPLHGTGLGELTAWTLAVGVGVGLVGDLEPHATAPAHVMMIDTRRDLLPRMTTAGLYSRGRRRSSGEKDNGPSRWKNCVLASESRRNQQIQ